MSTTSTLVFVATLFAGLPQVGVASRAIESTPAARVEATSQTSFTRVYAKDTPRLAPPVATERPIVRYTPEALRAAVQGSIELEITVGVDGRVRDAMVVKSLDAVFGMDDNAVAALSRWRFEPATLDGKPVSARTKVTLTLTLR